MIGLKWRKYESELNYIDGNSCTNLRLFKSREDLDMNEINGDVSGLHSTIWAYSYPTPDLPNHFLAKDVNGIDNTHNNNRVIDTFTSSRRSWNGTNIGQLVSKIQAEDFYQPLFTEAFGDASVSSGRIS